MMRRVDLKTIAYWVSAVSLVVGILWLSVDTYDQFVAGYRMKSLWRGLSAALSIASLTIMLMHPPN